MSINVFTSLSLSSESMASFVTARIPKDVGRLCFHWILSVHMGEEVPPGPVPVPSPVHRPVREGGGHLKGGKVIFPQACICPRG